MLRFWLSATVIVVMLALPGTSLPAYAAKAHRQAKLPKITQYVVDDQMPTLWEIAVYLYGDRKMTREIARWNHLKKPYPIHVGQVLKLKKSPTLSPYQGNQKLIAIWSKKLAKGDRKLSKERHVPPAPPKSDPDALFPSVAAQPEPSAPVATPTAEAPVDSSSDVIVDSDPKTQ